MGFIKRFSFIHFIVYLIIITLSFNQIAVAKGQNVRLDMKVFQLNSAMMEVRSLEKRMVDLAGLVVIFNSSLSESSAVIPKNLLLNASPGFLSGIDDIYDVVALALFVLSIFNLASPLFSKKKLGLGGLLLWIFFAFLSMIYLTGLKGNEREYAELLAFMTVVGLIAFAGYLLLSTWKFTAKLADGIFNRVAGKQNRQGISVLLLTIFISIMVLIYKFYGPSGNNSQGYYPELLDEELALDLLADEALSVIAITEIPEHFNSLDRFIEMLRENGFEEAFLSQVAATRELNLALSGLDLNRSLPDTLFLLVPNEVALVSFTASYPEGIKLFLVSKNLLEISLKEKRDAAISESKKSQESKILPKNIPFYKAA